MLLQKNNLILSASIILIFISSTYSIGIVIISSSVSAQAPTTPANEEYHFVKEWGVEGSGNGQFSKPHDIAIDSSDNVYVSEFTNDRVQKFDIQGNFITKWGVEGSRNGQFYSPRDIAVDNSGNVYVSDIGNSRVQVFAPDVTNLSTNDKDNINGNTSPIPDTTNPNDGNEALQQSPAGITDQV